MLFEFGLIAVTCVVAILATLWDRPPRSVKALLILAALIATALSIQKSVEENRDKRFTQQALIASLNPTNSTYQKFT